MHPYDVVFLILLAGVVASVAVRRRHRRLIWFGLVASVTATAVLSAFLGPPPWVPAVVVTLLFAISWSVGVGVGILARGAFDSWLSWRRQLSRGPF
jgi:hypothetical protein